MRQTTAVRRLQGASPKHVQHVQGYDTSDSECLTYLKASLVFNSSREKDKYTSENVHQFRASSVSQETYQDLFSENQSFLREDWLDDFGYSKPIQSSTADYDC